MNVAWQPGRCRHGAVEPDRPRPSRDVSRLVLTDHWAVADQLAAHPRAGELMDGACGWRVSIPQPAAMLWCPTTCAVAGDFGPARAAFVRGAKVVDSPECPRGLHHGSRRRAVADQPNLQTRANSQRQGAAHGSVDPAVVVAKSATPQAGQQHGVGCPAPGIQHRSAQGGLVGGLQHQLPKWAPQGCRHPGVGHRQRRAEHLGHCWAPVAGGRWRRSPPHRCAGPPAAAHAGCPGPARPARPDGC